MKLLNHLIRQTIHPGSLRIPRKYTIKILLILRADTAAPFLKFLPAYSLNQYHSSMELLRFQLTCKLNSSLDSHIFSSMDRSGDQNCLSGMRTADYCIRKRKLTSTQFQESTLFRTRSSTQHGILQIAFPVISAIRITHSVILGPDIFLFLHSADHKHRRRMIIQLLFLTPHPLPDPGIHCHRLKPVLLQKLPVPGRPVNRRKRHLQCNLLHSVNIRTKIMIIQVLALHTLSVRFIRLTLFFIIKIAIPVRVKIKKLSARFQYTAPLFISSLRILQIPCQIPADHNIKHIILKFQILCIHLIKRNPFTKITCIPLRSIQHLLCIINSSHLISCLSQNNRKKSGSCSNIQNLNLILRFLRELPFQHLKPCPLLHPIQFLMINFRIPLSPGSPVTLNLR